MIDRIIEIEKLRWELIKDFPEIYLYVFLFAFALYALLILFCRWMDGN